LAPGIPVAGDRVGLERIDDGLYVVR